jgi:CrcB protein
VLSLHPGDAATSERKEGAETVGASKVPFALHQAQSLRLRNLVVYKASVSFVWVAIGGAAGSCLRFWVSLLLGPLSAAHGFPWATLAANVLGSLGLGLVFVLGEGRSWFGGDLRLLLGTGVMGGFTTYSAFNLESIGLMQSGAWGRAALYMGGMMLLCLLAGALGVIVGRTIRG